jgi:cyclophilin family peptidyl-prolyl cis-trans isomerase
MHFPRPTLFAISLLPLALISGCGGSGNQAPVLQPIPDVVVVAGRALPSLNIRAIDIDSTLLRYSTPEFPEDQQKGLAALNIPAKSILEFIGLSIAPITGKISGTPKSPGTYPITVSVQDNEGATDSKTFNIKIITESLSVSFESPQTAPPRLRIDAGDTSEGGTVAYCIKPGTETPKANDACFKSSADGGRTTTLEIPPVGQKLDPVYLFTKDAAGNVLSAGVPSVGSKPLVLIDTSKGSFVVELEPEKTKITTENFLKYVDDGFFNGTVFHRIISTFMVQSGGYEYNNGSYSKKPNSRTPITLERTKDSGLSNTKGTIAMARTDVPDSATSEFFINVVDNSGSLDAVASDDPTKVKAGYAVFGRVIPPYLGLSNDLPPALVELAKTAVSGSLGGGGEQSLPVGTPPLINSVRRIN